MTVDLNAERQHIRRLRSSLQHHPLRAFAARYALTVSPLLAASVLLGQWPSPWTWIVFAVVAGFTQNAFGILTHEAAHFFLHANKRTNDALADWLVCLPIFNTVQRYRDEHFVHHRQCCDDSDPYFGLYGPYERKAQVMLGFVMDLTAITAARSFVRREQFEQRPPSERVGAAARLALVQGAIAAALWALTGTPAAYLVLWVVPLATIPFFVNRIRTFVEHHAATDGAEANRATVPTLAEYFLIAPYGYSFHFEHHWMPDVPYYQLPWVHAELTRRGFAFGRDHLAPHGYLRTFALLFGELR
jgi:fatty acid desaturase